MAGLAPAPASHSFPAAIRDRRRPATRLARSGRDVRPPAVPTGIPGSGADPLRGQPDPAFQRMEGNRHRGAPNGDHRRALDLGRDRPGRPLPARLQLGNGPAVRHPDPGHRAHGDRSDAAGGPAQGRGGEHPALGRHRHRSHRRPAGGSGVQLHHLQRRRRWLATQPADLRWSDPLRQPVRHPRRLGAGHRPAPPLAAGLPAQPGDAGRGAGRIHRLEPGDARIRTARRHPDGNGPGQHEGRRRTADPALQGKPQRPADFRPVHPPGRAPGHQCPARPGPGGAAGAAADPVRRPGR